MSLNTPYHLHAQRQELLNQLDELEASTTMMAAPAVADMLEMEEDNDPQARLAWLERQRIGVLVLLNETERKLLAWGSASACWED